MSDRRFHWSVWLILFVNGAVFSSWAPRIPEIAARLRIGDASLGVALLGIAAGAIPAMAGTGFLIRRVPPSWVCVGAAAAFAAGLPLLAVAENVTALTVMLIGLGAASGSCDIAMNVTGLGLQHRRGRPLLSGLHSGYSLGVLAGALGAVLATSLHAAVATQFVVVAGVLVSLVACAVPALLGFTHCAVASPNRRPGHVPIPPPVVVLAICGLLLEGLLIDWSPLLLVRDLDAPATQGAVTLMLFSAAMFVSRASVDRWGRTENALALAALGCAVLVALAIAARLPWTLTVGIALTGLTLGPIFPTAINRAARYGEPAKVTAQLSLIGYAAHLLGPPTIGWLAQALTLPFALMGTVLAACIGISLTVRQR